jgi:hypothetical protein
MLPPKPYLPMYQKFGLIPEPEDQSQISYTVLTVAIYAILLPLIKNHPRDCTALTVRRKQGIFSINHKGPQHETK